MAKYINWISWLATVVVAWTIGYSFNHYYPAGETAWVYSLYTQKVEAARQAGKGKIIVVGGSGTHFGVDTTKIEQSLNMPVVNMGLHAGLGLNAILKSVDEIVEQGDIVVLIPEYEIIITNNGQSDLASLFGATIGNPLIGAGRIDQVFIEVMKAAQPGLKDFVFSLSGIKKQGYSNKVDRLGNTRETPGGSSSRFSFQNEEISQYSLWNLKHFQNRLEAKGARLIISMPWIFSDTNIESITTAKNLANSLELIAPVIYDEEINIKDEPSFFGDTWYHLSDKGREKRSVELAEQLKDLL